MVIVLVKLSLMIVIFARKVIVAIHIIVTKIVMEIVLVQHLLIHVAFVQKATQVM